MPLIELNSCFPTHNQVIVKFDDDETLDFQILSTEIDSQLMELAKDSDGVHKRIGRTV